jgi:hypothetical protein
MSGRYERWGDFYPVYEKVNGKVVHKEVAPGEKGAGIRQRVSGFDRRAGSKRIVLNEVISSANS